MVIMRGTKKHTEEMLQTEAIRVLRNPITYITVFEKVGNFQSFVYNVFVVFDGSYNF